jgi:copper chaperone CopZ
MKSSRLALVVVMMFSSLSFSAQKPASKNLAAGTYSAKVKALVCEGCAPLVEETLSKHPGLDAVSVDQQTSTVKFTVKPDSKITLAQLQKELKASADQMGMGADYSLNDVKPVTHTSESKTP